MIGVAVLLAVLGIVIDYTPWVNGHAVAQYNSVCSTELGQLVTNCGYVNGIFYLGWMMLLTAAVLFIVWIVKDVTP